MQQPRLRSRADLWRKHLGAQGDALGQDPRVRAGASPRGGWTASVTPPV